MTNYDYNKDEIKNNLDIVQIQDLVAELGGEPRLFGDTLYCKTICHGGDSHKLYYYDNTHLFKCYTGCSDSVFDVFELARKVKSRDAGFEWELPKAIEYVAQYFGFAPKERSFDDDETIPVDDLIFLNKYDKIKNIDIKTQNLEELKCYDDRFLKNLPRPIIELWTRDHIEKDIMDYFEICYDPKNIGIVIPHRDINGRLIGVRERTLVKENEIYGKYRPAKIARTLYNHPLSKNLYGIYQNKAAIQATKRAFVFEAEKSVLQLGSYLGIENNPSVAVCGSSLIQYQVWLLIQLGVEEIIVCLDKQYQTKGDKEHEKLVKNLKNIHNKYGNFIKITYLFDTENLLNYKDSPTDQGKDIFMELYKRRFSIYE